MLRPLGAAPLPFRRTRGQVSIDLWQLRRADLAFARASGRDSGGSLLLRLVMLALVPAPKRRLHHSVGGKAADGANS